MSQNNEEETLYPLSNPTDEGVVGDILRRAIENALSLRGDGVPKQSLLELFKRPLIELPNETLHNFILEFGGEICAFYDYHLMKDWDLLIPAIKNRQFYGDKIDEFINWVSSDRQFVIGKGGSDWSTSTRLTKTARNKIQTSLKKFQWRHIRPRGFLIIKRIFFRNKNTSSSPISKLINVNLRANHTILDNIVKYIDVYYHSYEGLLWTFKKGCSKTDQAFFQLFWSKRILKWKQESGGEKKFRKRNLKILAERDLDLKLVLEKNKRFLFWLSGISYDARVFHLAPPSLRKNLEFIRISIVKNPQLMNELYENTFDKIGTILPKDVLLWSLERNPDILNTSSFPDYLKTFNLVELCLEKKVLSLEKQRFFEKLCLIKKSHFGSSWMDLAADTEPFINRNQLGKLPCMLCHHSKRYPNNTTFRGTEWSSIATVNNKCFRCQGTECDALSIFIKKLRRGKKGVRLYEYFQDIYIDFPGPETSLNEILEQIHIPRQLFHTFLRITFIRDTFTEERKRQIYLIRKTLSLVDKLSLKLIGLYLLGPSYFKMLMGG